MIPCVFLDKLANGPPIKSEDADALRRFSIALTVCKNTLKEIGYLSKMENPKTFKAIVKWLPFGLRQKWRDVADNITENQGKTPLTIQATSSQERQGPQIMLYSKTSRTMYLQNPFKRKSETCLEHVLLCNSNTTSRR